MVKFQMNKVKLFLQIVIDIQALPGIKQMEFEAKKPKSQALRYQPNN